MQIRCGQSRSRHNHDSSLSEVTHRQTAFEETRRTSDSEERGADEGADGVQHPDTDGEKHDVTRRQRSLLEGNTSNVYVSIH